MMGGHPGSTYPEPSGRRGCKRPGRRSCPCCTGAPTRLRVARRRRGTMVPLHETSWSQPVPEVVQVPPVNTSCPSSSLLAWRIIMERAGQRHLPIVVRGHTTMGKPRRNNTEVGRTVVLEGGFSVMSRSMDRRDGLGRWGSALQHQPGGEFR